MKKELITKEFIFNYDESLEPVVLQSQKMVNYQKILKKFDLKEFRQVKVNMFDNQESFIAFLKIIHGENAFIPKYCCATFDNNEINLSVNLAQSAMHNACIIFHELIHIIYKELIYKTNKNRIVWFDEGLAKCISGERSFNPSREEMIHFIKTRILPKEIPSISKLNEHGETFCNQNYNGYDLSFLCVRYLMDSLTEQEFLNAIKNVNKVKDLSENIIQKSISFYMLNKELEN